MQGLYAIVDVTSLQARGLDVAAHLAAVIAARPAAVQLRDKRRDAADTLALLRHGQRLAADAGVPLFANDRVDLAALAGCHGVHVGQRDMPPSQGRQVAAELGHRLAFGMSVHDDRELEVALAEAPDYLAFGPVFATPSKANHEPVIGLTGLERLLKRARAHTDVPMVAIGGIDAERIGPVAALCPLVAVIGALLPPAGSSDPVAHSGAETRRLHQLALEAA